MGSRDRLPLRVALPLFFGVGVGALVVETTWLRWIRGFLGATAPAISAGLVALALGQLGGALLGARLSRRSRHPLRVFGIMLLGAVALSFAVEPLLDAWARSAHSTSARFAGAWFATLPASTAIGAALPLLVTASSDAARDLGSKGTAIYAADLLGAALGAALAVFWLPSRLGVSGSYLTGVTILTIAALVSLGLASFTSGLAAQSPHTEPVRPRGLLFAISLASGFGVFAAELLLHQAFGRVLDQSTIAVGAVLATTLACLAIGTIFVAWLQSKFTPTHMVATAGVLAAIGFALFPRVFDQATGGLSYVVSDHGYLRRSLFLCITTAGFPMIAAACVLPATFAWSSRESDADRSGAGELAGALLAANTAGAIAGALVGPYVFLPRVGLWPSFALVGTVYFLIAILAVPRVSTRVAILATAVVALGLGGTWALAPLRLTDGDRLVETRRSAAGLVAVIERDDQLLIQTDNHYALGGTADTVRQERQGHLPLLLHPSPKTVAFIGTATGSSAGAAFDHGVEELVAVEIMPGVTDLAADHFSAWNSGVYTDPRTHVVHDDARSFMRRNDEPFDVIVADLFVPWRAETGALYTVGQFERTKASLADDGVFCQWLPLYQLTTSELGSIMATFAEVFEDAIVFRGDFYGAHAIIALCGGAAASNLGQMSSATERLAANRVDDRWVSDPLGPWALYVGRLDALAPRLADAPLNTDDRPFVELSSASNTSRQGGRRDWIAAGPSWLEWSNPMSEALSEDASDEVRASAGGYALQSASTYWVARRRDASGRALSIAAALLPDALVRSAPPDPTAADVWPDR